MSQALTFLGVFLAALPVSAQTVTDAPSLAIMDLIAENGCSISESEASQLFPAARISREMVRKGIAELLGQGALQFQGDRIVLVSGRCNSGADLPSLVPFQEQYISIVRHNGCQFQGAERATLFPRYGMDINLAAELEEGLVDSGIAQVQNDTLTIGPGFCIPDAAFAARTLPELTVDERHLVEILETGYCTLVQSEIEISFPQGGMEPEQAQAAAGSLLASGLAMAVEGGDRIWVSPAVCQPWSERKN